MLNIKEGRLFHLSISFVFFVLASPLAAYATKEAVAGGSTKPWWLWPMILFFLCHVLEDLAGVGGGVLYVSLVSGFFPFHIDFVRGVGLMLGSLLGVRLLTIAKPKMIRYMVICVLFSPV